ncbi:hypothetical protein C2G38_1522303 [Gigaspora rosea]|uniref:MD-2-related lipid-recognition domain-containing protein n=1 Tax=Gigaspora rosea TaxID=44941 RepID=A0A397V1J3_9GLOM|nr:hypothetical protein C2G38_1522303 [Gigaspora rosea]
MNKISELKHCHLLRREIMNFIFVFSLFAILIINAAPFQLNKRSTIFDKCSEFFDFVNATMNPDPLISEQNAEFHVFGTLTNHNITEGQTILHIRLATNPGDNLIVHNQNFTESILAHKSFSINATAIPVPKLPSNGYFIVITIIDPGDDEVYACTFASF